MEPVLEELSEAESLRLIGQAQIGRIGFTGRFGPVVLPVNFKLVDGAVIFRTEEYGHIAEDLRTGITGADYKVAFEVDQTDAAMRTGWSVLIQGAVHHVDDEEERASLRTVGLEPWAGGERALFLRIVPSLVTGRRISRGS
jgi:nitroimidazol reductase NimA-like FMN-containing flavoprotein (pyridoxamine 5'-phosphate oxidase superfamily)